MLFFPYSILLFIYGCKLPLPHFSQHMLDGSDRMIQDHSRPRPTHHRLYSLLHRRSVAMDGTHLTGRLRLPITAAIQPPLCVIQQLLTTRAERMIALFPPAIQTYHLLHYTLLFLYAFHLFFLIFYLHESSLAKIRIYFNAKYSSSRSNVVSIKVYLAILLVSIDCIVG